MCSTIGTISHPQAFVHPWYHDTLRTCLGNEEDPTLAQVSPVGSTGAGGEQHSLGHPSLITQSTSPSSIAKLCRKLLSNLGWLSQHPAYSPDHFWHSSSQSWLICLKVSSGPLGSNLPTWDRDSGSKPSPSWSHGKIWAPRSPRALGQEDEDQGDSDLRS